MEAIYIAQHLKLAFQKLPHTIRLVVLKDDQEWVCRKETIKNLLAFVDFDKQIFKGRLQLFKFEDRIDIHVLNQYIGSIATEELRKALTELI